MASTRSLGTAPWLRSQWSNPSDIFTILLIIGGDVIQVAIAQLCAGPVPYFTPVVFSFGWVTYAVSALLSAVGENKLMPKPEVSCCIIGTTMGYRRNNCSWVLGRLLRDFEFWRDPRIEAVERKKLEELKAENRMRETPREDEDVRIGLRVTVWSMRAAGKPKGDIVYWAGTLVVLIQLSVAALPWVWFGESLVFINTIAGTLLAFASGALPQWQKEKLGVRPRNNDIFLTRGNGDHDVLFILGCEGGMDLEALASPYRYLGAGASRLTRLLSLALATCWVALLISVAGYQQHTWYLVGVGMIGILHNVAVAGMPRKPSAFAIDLAYQDTYVDGKVMAVLWALEEDYPNAGASLLAEFFPGKLFPREKRLWKYARRRHEACKDSQKSHRRNKERILQNITPSAEEPSLSLWDMPPLNRPNGRNDDHDIPVTGRYKGRVLAVTKLDEGCPDHIVQV